MAHGIFCLEGEWWGDYKKPTTVEPALELFKSIEGLRIPYVHRNVATTEEFTFYIDQWLLKKHSDLPILYLAFHGDSGCVCVGDQRRAGSKVGLDWFEKRISGRGANRAIYFGSCLTLDIHGNRVRSFLQRTGLAGVVGFREEVGWLDSMLLDISMLSEMALSDEIDPHAIRGASDRSRERMAGLCKELNLKVTTA